MYVDVYTGSLLPTLPPFYKNTSNFNLLTDDELRGLGVIRVSSFVEDENYRTFLELLGTEYYPLASIKVVLGAENMGENVRILLDKSLIIEQINAAKDQSGNYLSVGAAITGTTITEYDKQEFEQRTVKFSDIGSYVFICLGKSHLILATEAIRPLPAEIPKYILRQSRLEYFYYPPVGTQISQPDGFSGEISFVDEEMQVIKVINCVGIDALRRDLPIIAGKTTIYPEDIFCFEIYKKFLSDDDADIVLSSMSHPYLISSSLSVSTLHTNTAVYYDASGRIGVRDDESSYRIRVEYEAQDTRPDRERILNDYGRLV